MQPDEQEPEVLAQARKDAFHAQIDLEERRAKAAASAPSGHAWRKQGPHLVCMSCPTPHAHWVGLDFDTKHLTTDVVSHSGLSVVPTPSDEPDGDITPTAATEPDNQVERGRKKGAK